MNGIPPLSSRDAHASPPQRVLERLHSSAAGLDADEAARRLAAHGYNRLPAPKRQGPLLRLLRQFHNVLLYMMDYALQSGAGLAFEHPVSKPVVLTSREKEVLQWCAIGKTSWEISVICNCSEANVNFHMGNIRRKFGVTSRRVAAIMAVNLGLITL